MNGLSKKLYSCFLILGGVFFMVPAFASDITISSNTTWPDGNYTYDNVMVTNNAVLTFDGAVTLNAQRLTIDSGSSISADGKGYGPCCGPGAPEPWSGEPCWAAGAGHGGKGGAGRGGIPGGITYGSAVAPEEMGSGSKGRNSGTYGGGAIKLVIGETLTINGVIRANGENSVDYYAGGASAGSIYITAKRFEGTGSISVNGGAGNSHTAGGGGGGRIAVYYQSSNFSGMIEAQGGIGFENGENGTVVQGEDTPEVFDGDVIIDTDTTWAAGTYTYENVHITNGATLSFNRSPVILNVGNLTVDTGASISVDEAGYGAGQGPGTGTYNNRHGGGGGYGGRGGNGGWTGAGIALGGPAYGSAAAPIDLGSGGGNAGLGGRGGGAVKLMISGNLMLNGAITASGGNGGTQIGGDLTPSGGGGSGGSVYIVTSQLTGAGAILANGGKSDSLGGGGSGGRIAVYFKTSSFTGGTEAKGAAGLQSGEDGTVCFTDTLNNIFYTGHSFRFQENDSPFNFNKVILNNSQVTTEGNVSLTAQEFLLTNGSFNLSGSSKDTSNVIINNASVIINSSFSVTGAQSLSIASLTLNNSTLTLSGEETFSLTNLSLNNNSVLTHLPQGKVDLSLDNLAIDSTSSISTDTKGYPAQQGPGAAESNVHGRNGGGAGYGGKGGDGAIAGGWTARGGVVYGAASAPTNLGSGGGQLKSGLAGSGGGAISLVIYNTLTLNGKITANGVDGQSRSFLGEIFSGGGGSGGSVYIIAQKLAGSGSILSNGGNAAGGGGGAGGGRIAVYYKASTLTGAVEAKGGIGYQNGEDGTIVFQPISLDTPVTTFNLLEKSSTANVSQETLTTQKLNLSNVQITGDLTGTVDFSRLDLTAVTSGPFSGKGFIEAEFQTTLEGASYGGNLQGVVYPDSQGDKLYLKGSISGLLISGTCEGALSESTPGSGTFDKFEAAWKLNRLNTDSISAALALGGTISSQSSYSFTSQIYLYQGDFEGNAYGSYTGPLSAILTHLRLTSDNEYTGKGFSIISYNTAFEQGKGYSHNQLDAGAILEFQGLFENPLSGKLSAFLDENKSPKILSGTIERLDLGLTPAPDLKIDTWAPSRLSSGQTFDYIIELRNDGLKAAENVKLIDKLPFAVSFHDSTAGADYSEDAHQVVFQIPELSAKAIVYKRVAGAVLWGIPINSTFGNIVYIPKDEETPPPLDPTAGIDYEVAGDTQESALVKIKTSNQAEEVETIMSINVRESAEPVQPSFDVVETPLAVTTDFSLGSFSPTVVEGEWDAQNNARQITERAVDTAQRIIATTREGAEIIRSIREERDFLTWLYDNGYIDRTNYENYSQQKTIGYHGLRYFLPRIIDRLISNNLSRLGQRLRRLFRINESQRQIRQGIIRTIDGMKFYSDKELEAVIRASITEVLRRGGKPAETIERAWEIFLEERRLTFNSQISSSLAGHDPNELLVSPEGNVKPGDKLSYTINYENEGEGNAYGVYITDRLLANLDDATLVVNNGGKYDPATRAITWFIGELPSKQKGSVTFSVNVNSYAQDKSEVINFAAVYFPSVPEITRTNGTVNIVSLVIDTVAPVTEILPSPLPNPAGWNSADVTINLTAADNEDGTGVKEIHYALTGVTFEERTVSGASASITIPSEGTTTLNCYAVDNAGNTESPKSFTVKIDKTPPIISAQSAPQANASGWNNSDVIVSFTAEDSLSGVVSVNEPVNVTQEGAGQHIGGQAIDAAGNSASAYVVVNLDKTPPQVNITANPNLLWPPNHKTADVTIGGEAKDSLSGILLSTFKVDDEYKTIEPPISDFNTIVKLEAWRDGNDKDGRYYNVSVTTKDKAGNTASNVTTVICPHDRGKK